MVVVLSRAKINAAGLARLLGVALVGLNKENVLIHLSLILLVLMILETVRPKILNNL